MLDETQNAVDQGTDTQGLAQSSEESADAQTVQAESAGAPVEAPKVAPEDIQTIGGHPEAVPVIRYSRLAELMAANDMMRAKSDDDRSYLNELVAENMMLQSEVEKLHQDIETLKLMQPLELGAVQEGKPVDVTMTAKDYGFPNVLVHGEHLGQLHYLDPHRADVILENDEQVTVRPSDVRILKHGDGTTREIPAAE